MVTWEAPRPTGRAITGYHVRWRTGSDGWSQETGLPANASSFVITGLSAGTTYEVQVQAVAGSTTSAWAPAAPAPATTTVPTVRIKYDGGLTVAQSGTDFLEFQVQATAPVTSDLDVELTIAVDGAMVTVPDENTVTLTILAARTVSNKLRVDVDPDAAATDDGSVWLGLNPGPGAYTPATPINVLVTIDHLL